MNVEQPEPVDLVTNMAEVAEQVKDIAGGVAGTRQHFKGTGDLEKESGQLTEQLAEIADGVAEVTATQIRPPFPTSPAWPTSPTCPVLLTAIPAWSSAPRRSP